MGNTENIAEPLRALRNIICVLSFFSDFSVSSGPYFFTNPYEGG